MHAFFKTDKFRQMLDDDEIDRVVLGEDCIEWLRVRLSNGDKVVVKRPIDEDWGWTMALTLGGAQLWLNVQDWSFEEGQTWHLWLAPRGVLIRLNRSRYAAATQLLRQLLDGVLSTDSAIREVRWSETISTTS
jgi:hypothetical protein